MPDLIFPGAAAWRERYPAILQAFGWKSDGDHEAARCLARLISSPRRWPHLRTGATATVLGCGPGLNDWHGDTADYLVAADGAVTRCREVGRVPHIVVTDLDGRPEDLAWASARGALLVVHAHADNGEAVRRLVPGFSGPLLATRQCLDDVAGTVQLGGFTDGDRAVLLLEALGVNAMLVGFDWQAPSSHYTNTSNSIRKHAKLAWAELIVADVIERGRIDVTFAVPGT